MRDELEEAESRAQLGDYRGAMAILRGLDDRGGDDGRVLLLLGECQERSGDQEGAARTWTRLPDDAGARLRAGLAETRLGRYTSAREHLRAGLHLVRAEPDRVAEPGRLTHDLLVAWSEVAYRTEDPVLGDRLLGEAARAWPDSPHPLLVLAHRATDPDSVRRLFMAVLARIPAADMRDFIDREVDVARELPQGAVILELLLDQGLDSVHYETAMHTWRTRHRPLPG